MKNNKNIEDLKDWQSKQYSPGNFIGTGRVQRPISGLTRFPKVLVGIGVLLLLMSLLSLFAKAWILFLAHFIFAILFIYGGISRISSRKKSK